MANATTDTEKTTKSHSNRSQTDVTLDNMIRRTLRVSDPYDYKEVADALGKLYPAESKKMKLEAGGYPFFERQEVEVLPDGQTSSSAEMDQARRDIDRDLNALIGNSLLKDIQPELNGWASAIRSAVAEGIAAARFALDPRQRDKTFSVRRLLGDYARMARFVGAMTPTLNLPYRRLAKSLDEAAGVLMVIMGEAMANIGFNGGRFLLQVPLSELQTRRDAVVNALRNLIGTTQDAFGCDQWPRGLRAYRQFLEQISTDAHYDIRSLFQENELARIMDELIDRAAGTTADGLRALGATAQISLERFRRLVIFGRNRMLITPPSPPFTAFIETLDLFLNAFSNASSGSRLLAIARPAIVFYGHYGISGPCDATQRLQKIVTYRGGMAEALDCYLGCSCSPDEVKSQIRLDKILYDVDRVIDLYSLGVKDFEEPEQRAAAYGFILSGYLLTTGGCKKKQPGKKNLRPILEYDPQNPIDLAINNIVKELWVGTSTPNFEPKQYDRMLHELMIQKEAERQWEGLLQTMVPNCIKLNSPVAKNDEELLEPSKKLIEEAIEVIKLFYPKDYQLLLSDEFPEDYSMSLSRIKEHTGLLSKASYRGEWKIKGRLVPAGKAKGIPNAKLHFFDAEETDAKELQIAITDEQGDFVCHIDSSLFDPKRGRGSSVFFTVETGDGSILKVLKDKNKIKLDEFEEIKLDKVEVDNP